MQQDDGSYKFTENTSVNVSQGAAITDDNQVKIDAQGQTLTLKVQPTDDGVARGIDHSSDARLDDEFGAFDAR